MGMLMGDTRLVASDKGERPIRVAKLAGEKRSAVTAISLEMILTCLLRGFGGGLKLGFAAGRAILVFSILWGHMRRKKASATYVVVTGPTQGFAARDPAQFVLKHAGQPCDQPARRRTCAVAIIYAQFAWCVKGLSQQSV